MENQRINQPPFQHYWTVMLILGLSSAMSVALSLFRITYSGEVSYYFMNWNLLLAWIPLFMALALWRVDRRLQRSLLTAGLLFIGWFLFFPNAPYIVSDFVHFSARDGIPRWFDLVMIFSFAWNGLILGFLSLWIVQRLVEKRLGHAAGWLLVVLTLAATGFGIYLGRFLRWNSWDLFVHPHRVLHDVLALLVHPAALPRTIGVTLLFAGFLTVAYLTIALLPAALRSEQTPQPAGIPTAGSAAAELQQS